MTSKLVFAYGETWDGGMGTRKLLGNDFGICMCIYIDIHIYIKSYQIGHFKYVQLIVSQSYFNKTVKLKKF